MQNQQNNAILLLFRLGYGYAVYTVGYAAYAAGFAAYVCQCENKANSAFNWTES